MASYQVSGAGTTFVNGTYVENGTYNGYPNYEYVSGGTTYKLQYQNSAIGWVLTDGNTTYYTGKGGTTLDTVTNWSVGLGLAPAPTVTEVADSSGGSTGGKAYKVTFSGTHEAAGIYRESGTYNGFPAYKHESLEYYIWTILAANDYMHYLGTPLGGSPPLWYYNSGSNADAIAGSWGQASSTIPGPTVTEYTEDTSGGSTDCYIVSGAGLTTVNGEYSLIGEYNGKPLYQMPNVEMYIRYSGTAWQITTIGASSQAVTPIYYGEGDVPENVSWSAGSGFSPMPTVTKGGSAGEDEDSGTSTIAGYRVAGAGTTAVNGDYLPSGEYGGRTMYQYGSYYLRFNGAESNPGWQIYDGSNILYFGSGATPEVVTWYNSTGTAPAPTVTVIEGTGDSGGGDDTGGGDSTDTTIVVPEAAPEVGARGFKIGDMFIPICPNPADTHLSKVSATGKNIALDWITPDFDLEKATEVSAGVTYQAPCAGWLIASGTTTHGMLFLAMGPTADQSGAFQFQACSMFVPRGWHYLISAGYSSFAGAYFVPCKGATE